ncbi:selenbp1 [Scenedesmus sp. PABB004]|nr:selenbp1 [Scenedesmus sp. PABB004]
MASCCAGGGPGYATPLDAMRKGPREALIYVPCIIPDQASRPDYLAVVDVDPGSATYSTVIHRLPMPAPGDELHHSGWNACSSCHGDATRKRQFLILPGVKSGNIYAVDVSNERAPTLHKVVEGAAIAAATGLAYPHTSHCLGSGDIMISTMGGPDGKGKGNFLLLDDSLNIKGTWSSKEDETPFGYDYWYQPAHDVMVSSEFGTPAEFFKGFDPAIASTEYGSRLYVHSWKERSLRQTIELGPKGMIPLETRFLHDPQATVGFVGCALSSSVVKLDVDPATKAVGHSFVIEQPWLEVGGWALPTLPPLITDILISLDDRWLFFSNWLRGDVCMYDISDPSAPRLASRLWLGGSIAAGRGVTVSKEALATVGLEEQPPAPVVKGVTVLGGPQMLQLSLDGKRLYVTNSLLSPWDKQFYPDLFAKGSQLVQVDVDAEAGSLSLNPDFVVDFGSEPGGPVLAHECRYPGGDCSSDIWL